MQYPSVNHLCKLKYCHRFVSLLPFVLLIFEPIDKMFFNHSSFYGDFFLSMFLFSIGILFVVSYFYEQEYWFFKFIVKLAIFWGNISIIFKKYQKKNSLLLGYGFGLAGLLSGFALIFLKCYFD